MDIIPKLGYKDGLLSWSPPLALSEPLLWRNQAVELWVALQRGSHDKELMSPANCQQWLEACQQPRE